MRNAASNSGKSRQHFDYTEFCEIIPEPPEIVSERYDISGI
jgi:hypothetical protein